MEYLEATREFVRNVFQIVALSLDFYEKYFDDFAYGPNSESRGVIQLRGFVVQTCEFTAVTMCRAPRYPPTTPETAAKSRGIGAHTDFGALNLRLQDDISGLEVFHRPSETWHLVHPVKDAYVVNIGDMMGK
jgi:isopenicillin N synthase-like dioxygenase